MTRLAILLTFLSLLISNPAFAKKATYLQGYDVVVANGESIQLSAKLETRTLRRDIKGAIVEFWSGSQYLGKGRTNGDGVASLKIKNPGHGMHIFELRLPKNSKYKSNQGKVVALSLDPDRKIAISDIDHTLSDGSYWQILRGDVDRIPTLPGAARAIEEIARDYQIIYLTARDDLFMYTTKKWLERKNFILAPAFFWDFDLTGGTPVNHGEYKSGIIKQLKKKFPNILVGFGDKPHDVKAYRDHGLRAYYIGDPEAEDIHPESIQVKSWNQILNHMEEFEVGQWPGDPKL